MRFGAVYDRLTNFCSNRPMWPAARQQKIQDASARYKTPPGASHQGRRWSFFCKGGWLGKDGATKGVWGSP